MRLHKFLIKDHDLSIDALKIPRKGLDHLLSQVGQGRIAQHLINKVRQMHQAFRRDEAEFRRKAAYGIGELGATADELIAQPHEHLRRLFFGALDRNEAHGRAAHRFANRLGVDGIRFAALHIGRHVLRRHENDIMAEGRKLTRPMMRTATGFKSDPRRRHPGKEG